MLNNSTNIKKKRTTTAHLLLLKHQKYHDMRSMIKIKCCLDLLLAHILTSNEMSFCIGSHQVFFSSIDQSATSLLILMVLKTEHRMEADVRLVNFFNCLSYD